MRIRPKKPKIVYVKRKDKRLQYGRFIGLANYKDNKIYIDETLTEEQRRITLHHEKGHFILRQLDKDLNDKKVIKELINTGFWKSRVRDGYNKNRILEEIFVETRALIKTGIYSKRGWEMTTFKNYPHTYKYFKKLFKEVDTLWK